MYIRVVIVLVKVDKRDLASVDCDGPKKAIFKLWSAHYQVIKVLSQSTVRIRVCTCRLAPDYITRVFPL